jgi:voltage-gated potassium channel
LRNGNYECFILALSALSLINIALALLIPDPETRQVVLVVDAGLSLIFLADFAYRLFSAPSKRGYFVGQLGWLDLIGSLPFPGLRVARLFRVVRAARLLRGVGLRRLWFAILRDRAGSTLLIVVFLTLVLLEVASALMLAIERDKENANIRTASDALWWTYVTVTTVGYGDRFPVTDAGRLVGAVTLTLGVGLFGALTGFLANAFLRAPESGGEQDESGDAAVAAELAELRRRVRELQADGPRDETAGPAAPG